MFKVILIFGAFPIFSISNNFVSRKRVHGHMRDLCAPPRSTEMNVKLYKKQSTQSAIALGGKDHCIRW